MGTNTIHGVLRAQMSGLSISLQLLDTSFQVLGPRCLGYLNDTIQADTYTREVSTSSVSFVTFCGSCRCLRHPPHPLTEYRYTSVVLDPTWSASGSHWEVSIQGTCCCVWQDTKAPVKEKWQLPLLRCQWSRVLWWKPQIVELSLSVETAEILWYILNRRLHGVKQRVSLRWLPLSSHFNWPLFYSPAHKVVKP